MIGNTEYDSKTALNDLIKYVMNRFGLKLETLSLHLHGPAGHVVVTISNNKPVEVTLESMEYVNTPFRDFESEDSNSIPELIKQLNKLFINPNTCGFVF